MAGAINGWRRRGRSRCTSRRSSPNYSLPQIARDFGKKDHTTVMYARDKIKDQMQRDEAYRNKIRQLIAMCQNP